MKQQYIRIFKQILFIMSILLFTSCNKIDNEEQPSTSGFLWKLTNNNATVYLFATIEIQKKVFFPIPEKVRTALSSSQKVYLENLSKDYSSISKSILQKATDNKANSIATLPTNILGQIPSSSSITNKDLNSYKQQNIEIWFLNLILEVREKTKGTTINLSISNHIERRALNASIPLKGILTASETLAIASFYNDVPKTDQITLLTKTLNDISSGQISTKIKTYLSAYINNDYASMETYITNTKNNAPTIQVNNKTYWQIAVDDVNIKIKDIIVNHLRNQTGQIFIAGDCLSFFGTSSTIQLTKTDIPDVIVEKISLK